MVVVVVVVGLESGVGVGWVGGCGGWRGVG